MAVVRLHSLTRARYPRLAASFVAYSVLLCSRSPRYSLFYFQILRPLAEPLVYSQIMGNRKNPYRGKSPKFWGINVPVKTYAAD